MRAAVPLLAVVVAACGGDGANGGWMSALPDERALSELSIPGTHESAALYDLVGSGTARNQETTISQQLTAGVRYFDIRCRHVDDAFQLYHGIVDQMQTFDELLDTMAAFLDGHPDETVIMSIQQTNSTVRGTRSFQETFQAYVERDPSLWYLDASVPLLGDVRGRIVLIRRFASMNTPLGLDATSWKENDATFTISTPDATLRIQDEFEVNNNNAKWTAITNLFLEARSGDPATLFLNFTSGYNPGTGGLPDVDAVSDDINARLDGYFADPANEMGRMGIVAMDFINGPRVKQVIERN